MTVRDMTLALHKSVDNLQIHLTSLCEWYIRVEKDGRRREFIAETIEESLQEALDYKWLPLVPKRPQRYEYTVQKRYNGQYAIMRNGVASISFRLKRGAESYLKKFIERDEKAIEEWEEKYAWTLTKQEGVDFEYKR